MASHPLSRVVHVSLPPFAVVDLETSGTSSRWHRILQLGLVTVEADGTVIDQWSTLVKLRWPLQRVGPTHVHGLRRRDLRHAPALDGVLEQLAERLDGAVFTAHNAAFDGGFLLRAARKRPDLGMPDRIAPGLCTLRMSRRLDPDRQQSHRLGDVCARYGVPLERPHEALADAEATARLLPHLLRAHEISTAEQLEPFFERTIDHRAA